MGLCDLCGLCGEMFGIIGYHPDGYRQGKCGSRREDGRRDLHADL